MTEERYLEVIRSKTAVLISAACRAGGILGGVSAAKEEALAEFGMELGIAFQLMDDTLDYISTEEEFGKSIGHDLEEGKVTLPLIYTLQHCSDVDRSEICDIIVKDELDPDDFQ